MNFASAWNAQSAMALQRREAMLARIQALRALEQRSADKSAEARPVFEKRGQLLPRERVGLLLQRAQLRDPPAHGLGALLRLRPLRVPGGYEVQD